MIEEPYTLFSRIPLYRDDDGRYATDVLWKKDLDLHLRYIADFRICCPVERVQEHDKTSTCVSGLIDQNVIALRRDGGWLSVSRNLFPNAFSVWNALSNTHIAHSGSGGWAFPVSYYILVMRLFLSFKWIMIIESSNFRNTASGTKKLRRYFSHYINTFLLRRCVRTADARIFTSQNYRDIFLGNDEKSLVYPAVWIDAGDVVSRKIHSTREPDSGGRARFVFPARLVAEKGVEIVLEALRILQERHIDKQVAVPRVDIIGHGPLAQQCRSFAESMPNNIVNFYEPISYGKEFLNFLQNYDAVIVANLQDEQPRIIYDAFSQGLPCISSETGGTKDLIKPGKTGIFFKANDPFSLADRLIELADAAMFLHEMGQAALNEVASYTHENMHRKRELFLKSILSLKNESLDWIDE